MDLQLHGRRTLVTGATAGIGRQVALALGAEGAALALVGRRASLLEAAAAEARAAGAIQAAIIPLDMMAEAAPIAAMLAATDALGGIDILVNCMGGSRPIEADASDAVWDEAMTLNWTRHRQLATQALPGMRERRWGRIVNVTGPNEMTGLNAAGVAKVAVHAWAKGLSDLVARDGITVNCVAPGRIDSEQMRRIYTPERRATVEQAQIPAGRFGEPAELADLVAFLASPRAAYITGVVIPVDGGARRYLF